MNLGLREKNRSTGSGSYLVLGKNVNSPVARNKILYHFNLRVPPFGVSFCLCARFTPYHVFF